MKKQKDRQVKMRESKQRIRKQLEAMMPTMSAGEKQGRAEATRLVFHEVRIIIYAVPCNVAYCLQMKHKHMACLNIHLKFAEICISRTVITEIIHIYLSSYPFFLPFFPFIFLSSCHSKKQVITNTNKYRNGE